jgi:ammonium transporter, Amt family
MKQKFGIGLLLLIIICMSVSFAAYATEAGTSLPEAYAAQDDGAKAAFRDAVGVTGAQNAGDTAFMFACTVLVFIMTPGLAFFYGGMVRRKNVLNTMMNSFVLMAVISIQWLFFGYSIAFGAGGPLFGIGQYLGFSGVGAAPSAYAGTIPHTMFALFQLMFAIITPALISGAFAERMKFSAFLLFSVLWATLVYDPVAHWVWGADGWMSLMNPKAAFQALDFAGGTVVHISSGFAGLVLALMLGKRKEQSTAIPHNIPFVLLGAALLWFGWFGFNGGSALGSGGLATHAFLTTNTAAAAATLSWMLIERIRAGKPTVLGAATGAVVGLVAITPGAGFVTPVAAVVIGALVSPLCYLAVSKLKYKLGYDDALDAFGCHGIGGFFGAVMTGVFATTTVNPAGRNGLLHGNPQQFLIQLAAASVTAVFSVVMTYLIMKGIGLVMKTRVEEKDEMQGMDITQHGEDAYPDFSSDQSIA